MDGGAPSNFLLLRNDKLAAPFGSTVKKGWLHETRGKIFTVFNCILEPDRLGPEEHSSESYKEARF